MYSFNKTLDELKAQLQGKKLVSAREIITLGLVQSEATLMRWREEGKGPPCLRLSKGKYLFPVDGLISWLESCLINTSVSPEDLSSACLKNNEAPER